MRRVYQADFAGDLDLINVRDLVKGMRRELGESPRRERWGVRTQQLQQALDQCLPVGACRAPASQMWRAALTSAFCGLLRGCEYALPDGEAFDPARHLTRADIEFREVRGCVVAVLMIHKAKDANQLTGKTTPVFLCSGGRLLDPVLELKRMLELDPVASDKADCTPLFRDQRGDAISRRQVAAMVRRLMTAIGVDGSKFGAHSLRIGGATAALAAGIDPSVIRIMGRWSSDVWRLYARLSKEAAYRASALIGSTPFEDLERGSFVSEEFEYLPSELARLPAVGHDSDSDDDGD